MATAAVLNQHLKNDRTRQRQSNDLSSGFTLSNQSTVVDTLILVLAPILQRNGVEPSGWRDLIEQFGRLFKGAVGSPQSLSREA